MSTATQLERKAPFTIAPITYPAQAEAIQKLADEYLPLTVKTVDDKKGLAAVHDARMKVRNLRLAIEARRKELKASSLEYGREVDKAAKSLIDLITPIESHLENEESIVAREKARVAQEAEEKRQAMIRERLQALQACGKAYMAEDVATLPQDEFDALLAAEQAEKKSRDEQAAADAAERERIAAANKLEADRLAKIGSRMTALAPTGVPWCEGYGELPQSDWLRLLNGAADEKKKRDDAAAAERAALDKQRQEQAAAQAKIDAEKKRLADEEADRVHRAAIAKAAEEAAERARLEVIAEQERVAAAEKAHAAAAEKERQRREALRPDHEKLLAVADSIEAIQVPEVSEAASEVAQQIKDALRYAARDVRGAAGKLIQDSAA